MIVAAVLTRADPAAVRMPVLVLCAAAYGLALAWTGVRIAAAAAEGKAARTLPGRPGQPGVTVNRTGWPTVST